MLARIFLPITLALMAVGVSAIKITAPNNQTGWETNGSQVVTWSTVDTDPSNFTMYIIYPNTTSTSQNLIGSNVQSSEETYTYTPTRTLDEGAGYRINFVGASGGILAQSDYFSITTGTSQALVSRQHCSRWYDKQLADLTPHSTASSTSIVSATSVIGGPTTSGGSTTTGGSSTTAGSDTTSSTSAAASSTTSSSGASEKLGIPSVLLAIAGLIGVIA